MNPQPENAQEEPYLGVFVAALWLQRGERNRQAALEVAKQCAVLMIEHLQAYTTPPEAVSVGAVKTKNARLEPIVLHKCFDDVHTGRQPQLHLAKKEFGISHSDFQLLQVAYPKDQS